jgi:hypothetical protein
MGVGKGEPGGEDRFGGVSIVPTGPFIYVLVFPALRRTCLRQAGGVPGYVQSPLRGFLSKRCSNTTKAMAVKSSGEAAEE